MSDTPQLISAAAQAMMAAGQLFHQHGWVPATGGNFSVRLDASTVLITASGNHKGELSEADFLLAGLDGKPQQPGRKASYETGLHMQIYQRLPDAGAVLHTHSYANTLLSRRLPAVVLSGYELQKILPGAPDPSSQTVIPVFANNQNIAELAASVDQYMAQHSDTPAYLIAGHGLYAWGRTVAEARHRVEAIEFMLECHWRELTAASPQA